MKVGDEVTVVLGLQEEPTKRGVIKSGPKDDKWLVEFPAGGSMWFDTAVIDPGRVSLGPGRHRVTDPETARLAADAAGERLNEHQWLVLASLVEAGSDGLIDHDHEARNGLIQTSAGKRRIELVRLGLVEWSGRKRRSPSGQLARVWAVTARGVAVYQHHQRGAA